MANLESPGHNQDGNKYRSFIHVEGDDNARWKFGAPPNYDVVDKLFEEGRTKVWPSGSMEEKVQNLVKTVEMELFHKKCLDDFKSVDTTKFTLSVNGGKALSMKGIAEIGGGYNAFLQTSWPDELRVYNPKEETSETSHVAFRTAFPRGFALEVLQVYSGPPSIAFKFRHWAYMEGPFKGHSPTGELVELFGVGIFEVDEEMRVVKIEYFFDRGELLAPLTKGGMLKDQSGLKDMLSKCPVMGSTG